MPLLELFTFPLVYFHVLLTICLTAVLWIGDKIEQLVQLRHRQPVHEHRDTYSCSICNCSSSPVWALTSQSHRRLCCFYLLAPLLPHTHNIHLAPNTNCSQQATETAAETVPAAPEPIRGIWICCVQGRSNTTHCSPSSASSTVPHRLL